MDKGDTVISIFLDLKRHLIRYHPTLLNKLYAYGTRGNALNWFKSYLNEILQHVVYDSKQSETQTVKCGVPKGLILGPPLFIIYMNDICNASELLFSILYANDTSVQISGNDITYLVSSINVELELLSRWFKPNKLSLNAQKALVVVHRARNKDHDLSIQIDGSILNRSSNIKYLGVIIDHKLGVNI